eukprot:78398_1
MRELLHQQNKMRICVIVILALLLIVVIIFGIIILTSISSTSSNSSLGAAEIKDLTGNFSNTPLDGCNITSDMFEFVILLDNSCGLNEEQCDTQLRAISNLVASIKKSDSSPYISIISMTNINDNSQLSDVFIGFNAENYQLDIDAFSDEIIKNGPCGDGSYVFGSNPSLIYSINLAAIQLQYYGTPVRAKQKIIILSNCDALLSSVVTDSNEQICSKISSIDGLDNVDVHFINAPIPINESTSFKSQHPHRYISCLVGYNSAKITVVNSFDINTFNNKISSALPEICQHSKTVVVSPTSQPTSQPTDKNDANETIEQCEPNISHVKSDVMQVMDVTTRTLPEKVLPGSQFLTYAFNMLTGKPPGDLLVEGNYRQVLEFTFNENHVSAGSSDYLVPDQMDLPSIGGICHKQTKSSSVSSSSSLSTLSRQSADNSNSNSASLSASGGYGGGSFSASASMSMSHSNSQSSSNSREAAKSGKTQSSYTFSKAFLYAAQMRWDIINNLSAYKQDFIHAVQNITKDTSVYKLNITQFNATTGEYVGEGCCRDEAGQYQIWEHFGDDTGNKLSKQNCWDLCVAKGYCTGIDYRESLGLSTCNLHGEIITQVDPHCAAMECFRKTNYSIWQNIVNFGIGACSNYNGITNPTYFNGWGMLLECGNMCRNQLPDCTAYDFIPDDELSSAGYWSGICNVYTGEIVTTDGDKSKRCYINSLRNTWQKNYRYILVDNIIKTWNDAENYCNKHYGSHLATATNDDELDAIATLCRTPNGCFFGLYQWAGRNWKFVKNVHSQAAKIINFISYTEPDTNQYAVIKPSINSNNSNNSTSYVIEAVKKDALTFICDPPIDLKNIADSTSLDYKEIDARLSTSVIKFFHDFGTHVIKTGKMGAHCSKTTHFSSGMTSEAYSRSNEHAGSQAWGFEGSVSGSYSASGASASVSASFSHNSESSYSKHAEASGKLSETVDISEESTDCSGEVFISSICGDMFGTQNQPVLVGYTLKPVWEIGLFEQYQVANDSMLEVLDSIGLAGIECALKQCGGLGVCAANHAFWNTDKYLHWDGYDFSAFWNGKTCFNQYHMGTSLLNVPDDDTLLNNPTLTTSFQCLDKNSDDKMSQVSGLETRKEHHRISFDPFCEENDEIYIATGLTLVNRSISFQTYVSRIQSDSFYLTYALLSNGRNMQECTNIGGISYAVFCGETTVRTFNLEISDENGWDIQPSYKIPALEVSSKEKGLDSCLERGVVSVFSGFTYIDETLTGNHWSLEEVKIYNSHSVNATHVYLDIRNGIDMDMSINSHNSWKMNQCFAADEEPVIWSNNGLYFARFLRDGNFVRTNSPHVSQSSSIMTTLKQTNDGAWGKWATPVYCGPDQYVSGFRQKVSKSQGLKDDTAANAVHFICQSTVDTASKMEIHADNDMEFGDWSSAHCPENYFVIGFNQKVQAQQGAGDDTALNSIRIYCNDGNHYDNSSTGEKGSYAERPVFCPEDSFVCGFNQKVESHLGWGVMKDDTALNAIELYCCAHGGITGALTLNCAETENILTALVDLVDFALWPVLNISIPVVNVKNHCRMCLDRGYIDITDNHTNWSSQSNGQADPGTVIVIQDDGDLVIYDDNFLTKWSITQSTKFQHVAMKELSVSIIHFCLSDKLRHGEVAVNTYGNLILEPNYELWTQWVTYDHGPFEECDNIDIFVGFSGFQLGLCNLAVWTEDESIDGFMLKLSVWSSTHEVFSNADDAKNSNN